MAMDSPTLTALLKNKVGGGSDLPDVLSDFLDTGVISDELKTWLANNPGGVPDGKPIFDAISEAVIEHVQNTAVVNTTITHATDTDPVPACTTGGLLSTAVSNGTGTVS